MKWSDLSLKERKQMYDSIRKNNPNATYFDIKQQFDSIPAYEDGGKKKLPSNVELPPEYVTGTPEYFERQRKISGAANPVQPEAYITPAGYIKDAVNFVEDVGKGDYAGAAIDAALNLIPWGVGKGIKKIKSKVGRLVEGTDDYSSVKSYAPFTQTITKKKNRKQILKDSEPEHMDAAFRRSQNISNYESEISKSVEDAIFPDKETMDLINFVDQGYGTKYKRSYRDIAMRDMTNRGKYVSYQNLEPGNYGKMTGREVKGDTYSIDDFMIKLNPDHYMPGTANHELSHLADALNNPYTTFSENSRPTHYNNKYLDYLADYDNMLSPEELTKTGRKDLVRSRNYLSDPTEVKSHMIGLKRALIKSGKLNKWGSKVDENILNDYFNPRNNSNYINPVNRDLYDLYKDKQGFINRMNRLIPMEILLPMGGIGASGYKLTEE